MFEDLLNDLVFDTPVPDVSLPNIDELAAPIELEEQELIETGEADTLKTIAKSIRRK